MDKREEPNRNSMTHEDMVALIREAVDHDLWLESCGRALEGVKDPQAFVRDAKYFRDEYNKLCKIVGTQAPHLLGKTKP
jgi:hypothetical protein